MFRLVVDYLQKPVRFDILNYWLSKTNIKVMDVGCGNGSPIKTKQYYPNNYYSGIDITEPSLDENNLDLIDNFYLLNLDKDDLSILSNQSFDVIIMSHIIEHLERTPKVINQLVNTLNDGGVIYIETPHPRSVNFPSMKGTLNFYDDPTHKRVYPVETIIPLLESQGLHVIKSGTRRSLKRILLFPFYYLWVSYKGLEPATVFWDLLGFAYFVVAEKKKN